MFGAFCVSTVSSNPAFLVSGNVNLLLLHVRVHGRLGRSDGALVVICTARDGESTLSRGRSGWRVHSRRVAFTCGRSAIGVDACRTVRILCALLLQKAPEVRHVRGWVMGEDGGLRVRRQVSPARVREDAGTVRRSQGCLECTSSCFWFQLRESFEAATPQSGKEAMELKILRRRMKSKSGLRQCCLSLDRRDGPSQGVVRRASRYPMPKPLELRGGFAGQDGGAPRYDSCHGSVGRTDAVQGSRRLYASRVTGN